MIRARVGILGSMLLVLGAALAACQSSRPKTRAVQQPSIRDFFKDTGRTVPFPDARSYSPTKASERDSLHALLKRERALWRASTPQSYRFLLRTGCFCPGVRGWLLIEVRPGQPLRAWDRTGKNAPLTDWDTRTIDGLFDFIEQTADRNGAVQLRFDPELHYPTYIYTSGSRMPDTWSTMEARALRPK